MIYTKKMSSIKEQVSILRNRGLTIEGDKFTKNYLRNVGYHRLSGYWMLYYSDPKTRTFKEGTTFTMIAKLYEIDKKLRQIAFSSIETFEVSLRTNLTQHISKEKTEWWFEDQNNFIDPTLHLATLEDIRKNISVTRNTAIVSHRYRYPDDTRNPPSWKTLEILSMDKLTSLYKNLLSSIASKDQIAKKYHAPNDDYFSSWLETVRVLRNTCAHHGRLVNNANVKPPRKLKTTEYPWLSSPALHHAKNTIYINLCYLKFMLDAIECGDVLKRNLDNLWKEHHDFDFTMLGFYDGWSEEPLWSPT